MRPDRLRGLAAVRVEQYTLDGVLPVRGDVGDARAVADGEVIPHTAGRDEFGSVRGIERRGSTGTRMKSCRAVDL